MVLNFLPQKKIIYEKTVTKITDEWKAFIEEVYDFLEKFLVGNQYIAGNDITIADFSILTTLTNTSANTSLKMPVKLYCTIFSPPVRAVIHTLQALNVPYELANLNFLQGECCSEEFLKLNPQHTVPTIQDEDGFVIWESHAINAYLVNKYAKNDQLYPKDPKARAIVDQRLHFDNGVLFTKFITIAKKIFKEKTITKITDEWKAFIEEGYDFLEKFLVGNQYVAGSGVTIADFSILTTLCNSSVFVPVNSGKYPLIADYVKRSEANISGFKQLESEGKEKFLEVLKSFNFEF